VTIAISIVHVHPPPPGAIVRHNRFCFLKVRVWILEGGWFRVDGRAWGWTLVEGLKETQRGK
jgi:hypothetical protein